MMNEILYIKGAVAIVALLAATYLAVKEKEGWGWCIFIAFCCT